jgi:exopolyphosphatase/guanosine-5'-triphosphate,3'-diphosphate pyrophosphatase
MIYQLNKIVLAVAFAFLALFPIRQILNAQENQGNGQSNVVVRAAIDIGSGATKLRVAEVNTKTQKIEKILVNKTIAVPYQEELELSHNNTFNEKVIKEGLDALKESKKIANEYQAQKIVAIATASFRKADNAQAFIDQIKKETGIDVYVIDQDLEGKLAFEAVKSDANVPPQNLVVWDIGGGSLQLTTMDNEGNINVYRSLEASVPFKNYIIKNIQDRNIKQYNTPNPMNYKEMSQAEQQARKIASKVNQVFRDKILNQKSVVVGVGNIFSYRIEPMLNKSSFTIEDLKNAVSKLEGQGDKEVGNDSFSNVGVSNPILILGYMQELGIDHMEIKDINNADGAMLYPPFWK